MKIILTEEFDEGLMVLRRLLGWEMMDMTYVSMYKTVNGAHRFDGKPLVSSPRFDDLPEQVRSVRLKIRYGIFEAGSAYSSIWLNKKRKN